jgi:hypothetical protein
MTPPQFLIIPYELVKDRKINPLDERVYGVIYWLTQLKCDKCTASNSTLAELCQTTPTSLSNSLTKLEKRKYILREYKDKKRKVRVEIKPLIVFARVSPTDETVSPTGETRVSPTGEQNNRYIKNKRKKKVSSFKKKYFNGMEMRFAQGKWWCIPEGGGSWLEFAGNEKDIIIIK